MKRKHEGCEHELGESWTISPTRLWVRRCDTCDRFRLWADYYEVYSHIFEEGSKWWYECTRCLLDTVMEHCHILARESSDRKHMKKVPSIKHLPHD